MYNAGPKKQKNKKKTKKIVIFERISQRKLQTIPSAIPRMLLVGERELFLIPALWSQLQHGGWPVTNLSNKTNVNIFNTHICFV
jgi:hypothetical protein